MTREAKPKTNGRVQQAKSAERTLESRGCESQRRQKPHKPAKSRKSEKATCRRGTGNAKDAKSQSQNATKSRINQQKNEKAQKPRSQEADKPRSQRRTKNLKKKRNPKKLSIWYGRRQTASVGLRVCLVSAERKKACNCKPGS